MSADVLTTWGVVLTLDGIVTEERLESASHWFAQGRHAFFELCPRLAAFLRAEKGALRVTVEQIEPIEAACWAGGLTIGASVVEVRPSSFDMAVRIRPAIDDANRAANGRCTMVIERRTTGERIPISREIREEFIAIQLAARGLC